MWPPDWPGRIAFVLALAISITLVVGFLVAELKPGSVTDAEINFLSLIAGGAIAEIATYVALRSKQQPDEENKEGEDENSGE